MQRQEERLGVVIDNKGQKIFGVLHKPFTKSVAKYPAVLICHGFAGNKVGKHRIYVSLAEKLASAGIASLRIDFRGCGDSEGNFSEMTLEGEVSDALCGLNFLESHPDLDAARLGLVGCSFGAAVGVIAASRYPSIKSLTLYAALYSSNQWLKQWQALQANQAGENAQKDMQRITEGNIPGKAFFEEFFKLNLEPHLASLQHVPMLHIHSILDEKVSIEQAENYLRCRQGALGETKSVRLQKSDHEFSNVEERKFVIDETAQWFSKTL